jgi:hypothetical protein
VTVTLGSLLDGLAEDLADADPGHRHAVWPRAQLSRWAVEAFRALANAVPELFLRDVTAEIRAGPAYCRIPDVDQLTPDSVLGQCDPRGRVLWPLRHRPDGAGDRWQGPAAPSGGRPWRAREYAVGPEGDAIRVFPALPPGERIWLALHCAVIPRAETDEVPDKAVAPASQWVMYRARMTDGEHEKASLEAANMHLAAFRGLVGRRQAQPQEGGR